MLMSNGRMASFSQTYKLALVYRPELVQIHAIFEGNEDMARSMEQIQEQSKQYQWNGEK